MFVLSVHPLMCVQYTALTTLVVAVVSSISFLVLEREGSWADSLLCLGDCDQCVFGWTSNRYTPYTRSCIDIHVGKYVVLVEYRTFVDYMYLICF